MPSRKLPYSKRKKDYGKASKGLSYRPWRYGNYYGPNRSGGKDQPSIDYKRTRGAPLPVDIHDYHAREHDAKYARVAKKRKNKKRSRVQAFGDKDLAQADYEFARDELHTKTMQGFMGAAAVGTQGIARTIAGYFTNDTTDSKSNQLRMGKYGSSIPFPRQKYKPSKDKASIYGAKGKFEHNVQPLFASYGPNAAIGDANTNVNYCGFVSVNRNDVDDHGVPVFVAMALLRRILKHYYNVDINSPNQSFASLSLTTGFNGSDTLFRSMVFIRKRYQLVGPNTTASVDYSYTYAFDPAPTDTILSAAKVIAQNVICSAEFGCTQPQGSNQDHSLYGVYITENLRDGTDTIVTWSKRGIMRLDDEMLHLNVNNKLLMQNVTKNDSDTNATDVSDVNPLKARVYYFKHPYPMLLNPPDFNVTAGMKLMLDVNNDGVILPDADISTVEQFRQLPDAKIFSNLATYGNFTMSPGDIRRFNLTFRFNGKLQDYINGLKLSLITTGQSTYAAGPPATYGAPVTNNGNMPMMSLTEKAHGTSVLFAFEKIMSDGTTYPRVHFQRDLNISAYCKRGKKNYTMMSVIRGEQNAMNDDTTV